MSTVDDRIVRMQFDNKQFESGVHTTLKSLEELKSSLKFNGVEKGFDAISSAAGKVNLSNLATGVEQVAVKIPILGTIMDQTVRDMTQTVEGFLKKTLKEFSTVGIAQTAYSEYDTLIGATKTIQASTGESIEEINRQLGELNKYADDTIYSFTDMTQNIGKFTNAGVKLDSAVKAIKGVANEAAVSGATTQEASRAMYNFAQALAAGSVKLIDWKSIENANMATVEFKDELLKTALALGTVVQQGDKFQSTTTNNNGAVSDLFNATQGFNDALSHQWLTTEVLVQTLERYTDTTTEIGKKATEAATKVNTFKQAMDAVLEDLGSGWTQSWQYIVGDFEEATKLWSGFKDALSGVFAASSESRNNLLEYWSKGGQVDSDIVENAEELESKQKELMGIANRIWAGEFGNGEARFQALAALGYDPQEIQSIVDKMAQGIIKDYSDIDVATKKSHRLMKDENGNYYAWAMTGREMVLQGIRNLFDTFVSVSGAIKRAWRDVFPATTGEQLMKLSQAFMIFTEKLKPSEETLGQITRVARGLFAALHLLVSGIKIIVKALGSFASGIASVLGIGNSHGILELLARLGDLIFKFDQAGIQGSVFAKAMESIGKTLGTVIGAIVNWITALANVIKDHLDFDSIGEAFEAVSSKVGMIFSDVSGTVSKFGKIPMDGVDKFSLNMDKSFGAKSTFGKIFDKVTEIGSKVINVLKKVFTVIGAVATPILQKFWEKIKDVTGALTFDDLMKYLKGGGTIALLYEMIKTFRNLSKAFGSSDSFFSNLSEGVSEYFGALTESVNQTTKQMKYKSLLMIAAAITMLVGATIALAYIPTDKIKQGLLAISVIMVEIYNVFKQVQSTSGKSSLGAAAFMVGIGLALQMILIPLLILAFVPWERMKAGVENLFVVMVALVAAMDIGKIGGDAGTGHMWQSALFIMALAVAVSMLIVPLIALSYLDDKKIDNGIWNLNFLIYSLVAAFDISKIGSVKKGSVALMFAIAFSVQMLVSTILLLAFLPKEKIKTGIGMVTFILGSLVAAFDISKLGSTGKFDSKVIMALAVAVGILTISIIALSKLPVSTATYATGMIETVMGVLAGAIAAVALSLKDSDAKMVLAAIVVMAAAIYILINNVLTPLTEIEPEKLGIAFVALAGTLLVFVIAIKLLTEILAKAAKNATGIVVVASSLILLGVAFGVVAASIYIIVLAFEKMKDVMGGDIKKTIGAMVGIVAVLAIGMALLGKAMGSMGRKSRTMLKVATSFLEFGAAIFLVGAGVYLLIAALEKLDNMDITASLLKKVALFGTSIVTLVVSFITGLIASIATIGPTIVTTLLEVGTLVFDSLSEHLGEFVDSLVDFVSTLFTKLGEVAALVVTPLVDMIIAFIDAIIPKVEDLVGKIVELVCSIIDSVADAVDDIVQSVLGLITSVLTSVGDYLNNNENIIEIATAIQNIIEGLLKIAAHVMVGLFHKIYELGKEFAGPLVSGIKNTLQPVIDWFEDTLLPKIEQVLDKIKEVYEAADYLLSGELSREKKENSRREFLEDINQAPIAETKEAYEAGDITKAQYQMVINDISKEHKANGFLNEDFDLWWKNYTEWFKKEYGVNLYRHTIELGSVKRFASGGIVGEAGPELLTNYFGKTQVTPLTNAKTSYVLQGYFDRMADSITAASNRASNMWVSTPARATVDAVKYDDRALMARIDNMGKSIDKLENSVKNMKIVLDSGVLVGHIAGGMDRALGRRSTLRERGV